MAMKPFLPAELPAEAYDAEALAKKFRISMEEAQAAVHANGQTAVFMNDLYQVNVSMVKTPFGPDLGDVAWRGCLSSGVTRLRSTIGETCRKSRTGSLARSARASRSTLPRVARWTLPTSTICGCSPIQACDYPWALRTGSFPTRMWRWQQAPGSARYRAFSCARGAILRPCRARSAPGCRGSATKANGALKRHLARRFSTGTLALVRP